MLLMLTLVNYVFTESVPSFSNPHNPLFFFVFLDKSIFLARNTR